MKLKNKKETIFFRNINFNSNLFYKAYFFELNNISNFLFTSYKYRFLGKK